MLQWKEDDSVAVVGLYLEGTERGRALVEAARAVTPRKPVVALKGGRTKESDLLTVSHTGSLAGSIDLYRGAFAQAGIIQVDTVSEMVCALKGLAFGAAATSSGKVGVLTPSGSGSIVIHDLLSSWGTPLATLQEQTQSRIRRLLGGTSGVVLKNPLDLTTAGFQAGLYAPVAEAMARDPQVDILLAVFPVHSGFPPPDHKLIEINQRLGTPVMVYWIAIDRLSPDYENRKRILESEGIPVFLLPEEAAWAVRSLSAYHRNKAREGKEFAQST